MAGQGEATERQSGPYGKLSTEFVDDAYAYKEWFEGKKHDPLARARATLTYGELAAAKKQALLEVSSAVTGRPSEETIAHVTSVLETYGIPGDLKELQEVLALKERLVPGTFVLTAEGKLYSIEDAQREIIFTLEKSENGPAAGAIKYLAGWTVFGKRQGTEEVVGFPVNIFDAIGNEAIQERVRAAIEETTRAEFGYFTLGAVEENITILGAIGDTEGVDMAKQAASQQSYNELKIENHYATYGPPEGAFGLLEFVNPELFAALLDERAKRIATWSDVDLQSIRFYEGLVAYRKSLDEATLFDNVMPLEVLEVYKAEYERGSKLIATDQVQ